MVISPELADTLSMIICRIRDPDGAVPLVIAYDKQERAWNPPRPLLFQRRLRVENRPITEGAIRELLKNALADAAITDASGRPLRFLPARRGLPHQGTPTPQIADGPADPRAPAGPARPGRRRRPGPARQRRAAARRRAGRPELCPKILETTSIGTPSRSILGLRRGPHPPGRWPAPVGTGEKPAAPDRAHPSHTVAPAAQVREVFTAWRLALALAEDPGRQMSGGTTWLHAAARRGLVKVRLTATVFGDEEQQ
jgi:hypothetical protein